jgi:anti-sigma factor (TIGR02949 family)
MKDCSQVDALVTPYVDGEVSDGDREAVATHLDACPPCRRQAGREQAARELLREHASALVTEAPAPLRARCRAAAAGSGNRPARRLTASLSRWPLAMAATLVLAVAGAVLYGSVVNPSVAVAAQLTADHLKCFALFDSPAALSPAEVRAFLRARYGWEVAIPDRVDGLSLVGGRHCVYLDGSVAHLLYRMGGEPVSVFVLPPGEALHAHDATVMGYAAVSFERSGRTWVVLAKRAPAEVERIASALTSSRP